MGDLLHIDRSQLAPWRAARAAVVLVSLMGAGWAVNGPGAAIGMGISALVIGFVTVTAVSPGPGLMIGASAAMTVSTFAGTLAGNVLWVLLVCLLVWGCLAGLLTVLGPAGTTIGINAIIGLVAFGHTPAGPAGAATAAGWVALGGSVQAVVAWSTDLAVRRRTPERAAGPPRDRGIVPRGAGAATTLAAVDALWSTGRSYSLPLRHGIRLAVTIGAAATIAWGIGLAHGYWAPLSAALTLRPSFGTTFAGGVRRALGTCIGAGLAGLLAATVHPGFAEAALLIGVLSLCGIMLLRANAAAAIALYSAAIVLIIGLSGTDIYSAALDRAIAAVLGGALAVVAVLVWREQQAPDLLPAMLRTIEAERALAARLYTEVSTETDLDGMAASSPAPTVTGAAGEGWLALFAVEGAIMRRKDEQPRWPAASSTTLAAGLRSVQLVTSAALILASGRRRGPAAAPGPTADAVDETARAVDHVFLGLEEQAGGSSPSHEEVPVPSPAGRGVVAWHSRAVARSLTDGEGSLPTWALSEEG